MSEERYPVVLCDGDDGMCEEFELDHTLGGLGTLVGSTTQLPPGWSGDRPGTHGKHYCPECTAVRAAAASLLTSIQDRTDSGGDGMRASVSVPLLGALLAHPQRVADLRPTAPSLALSLDDAPDLVVDERLEVSQVREKHHPVVVGVAHVLDQVRDRSVLADGEGVSPVSGVQVRVHASTVVDDSASRQHPLTSSIPLQGEPLMTVDYDLDPDAIEWARGKVQWLIDKADRFADQGGENAEQWRRLARIIHMQLLGSGEGCVITPLDSRLPAMKASWSPDYDVPENVSPFKPLPLLESCVECRTPVTSIESMTAVRGGVAVSPLCSPCASSLPPAKRDDDA